MMSTLLVKTLRDRWKGLLGWSLGISAMVAIQLSVYPTVKKSAEGLSAFLENYPETLRQIFRMDDYTSGPGYLSTELFSFMMPLIFIAVGASWGSHATAIEEERGTADLLLTLPISRTRVLLTKMWAGLVSQIFLAFVLTSALLAGVGFVDLKIDASRVLAGALSLVLIGAMFHSLSMFLGALKAKKSIALGGSIAVALAGFLFYSLSPIVDTFDRLTPLNPFQWTLGSQPLTRGIDVGYTLISVALSLSFYALSVLFFRKRDISA
jgi:ABC-2 type transport system permease protein